MDYFNQEAKKPGRSINLIKGYWLVVCAMVPLLSFIVDISEQTVTNSYTVMNIWMVFPCQESIIIDDVFGLNH